MKNMQLNNKEALVTYLVLIPAISISAFFNQTLLMIYMISMFIISIGLTIFGN